jgi:alpha,alpha-trehalose-phosphate synthase [UDP-forming]/trehalose-phosphatase
MKKTISKPVTEGQTGGDSSAALRRLSDDFWTRVQSAPERLLMLDYDGTLVPFHTLRMAARPSEETLEILRKIIDSGHTKIVIVSGRPTSELRTLIPDLAVETFGSHGFERSPIDRTIIVHPLSAGERAGLSAAQSAAAAAGLGDRVETKPASIAVHVRGLDSEKALEIEELAYNVFVPIADRHRLECRAFNGGVEIRSRRFHKGLAVDAMLKERPEHVLAVYVGDDDTDEDAFRALSGIGIGVRVGAPAPDTAAQIQLENQEAVLPFLEKWHKCSSRRAHVTLEDRPSRLVVVSNRLPSIETDTEGFRRRPVGGLALAIEAALSQSKGGGLWMGWSGSVTRQRASQLSEADVTDSVKLIGVDLTRREHTAYYNGFSNNTIWPLFHNFPKLAELSSWQLEVYRSVNAMFAQTLTSLLQENDLVWVHDYHLMLLGEELRRFKWTKPIGFFLHTPFPALDVFAILPRYVDFLRALHSYDLVGFQTSGHRDNYVYACRRVLGAEWDGSFLTWENRRQRVGVYPVGIEPEKFIPTEVPPRRGELGRSLRAGIGGRSLIIGVDRLDYTKGMPERVLAFEALFRLQPKLKGKVSFVQICSPSRTEVDQYKEQRRAMDALVGRVNGELGEHDWQPIRYLYRSYTQEELIEFYREARVGLVTPLRDGMNLVAKEYVASQNPDDPGVLVLSSFAGAAEQLVEAVVVNPYLPDDAVRGATETPRHAPRAGEEPDRAQMGRGFRVRFATRPPAGGKLT